MRVRILGSAAGGGLPQWNCGCSGCTAARAGGVFRSQDTVAISADGAAWYLLNASPDLRAQLLATAELAPRPGTRDTPLRGVVLSTSELDHVLGLLLLREARHLEVYATPTVVSALTDAFPLRPVLAAYADVRWSPVPPGVTFELAGGLVARMVSLGAKRPRYAVNADGEDWVSAVEVYDPGTGGVLVYATCVAAWTDRLDRLVSDADCVLLDGTFLDDDEMRRVTGIPSPGRAMGHLPVMESLRRTAGARATVVYSHVNNTNPLATMPPDAVRALVGSPNVQVAADGQDLIV